jgi:hypothetical protein
MCGEWYLAAVWRPDILMSTGVMPVMTVKVTPTAGSRWQARDE